MENIKVAIWGFGAMGSGVAKVLLRKKGVDITGVCDIHPARVGKSIFEVLGVERGERADVLVSPDIEAVVSKEKCDVCIIATDSFTAKVFPKIKLVVEKGVNVIVSILGTGINPGLMMDLLAICLTGCMTDVESVQCRRVNSLSPFGPAVMEEQGVGLTVEAFERGVADGTLAGHVGFAESVGMIAEALGWKVDKFEQQMKPIVTSVDRKSPYGFAKAGDVAGVNMTGQGYVDGAAKIDMIHPQQIEPEMEGTHTGDYIVLKGSPAVSMAINPEVDGGIGTIAMIVNMIPHVINARPGLRTMLDLPVPRAIMGDFRDYIEK